MFDSNTDTELEESPDRIPKIRLSSDSWNFQSLDIQQMMGPPMFQEVSKLMHEIYQMIGLSNSIVDDIDT